MRLRTVAVATAALLAPLLLAPAPATADPGLSVSASGARLVPGGQQVVLTGRYSCGPFGAGSDYGVVDLTLTQPGGGITRIGYGYV